MEPHAPRHPLYIAAGGRQLLASLLGGCVVAVAQAAELTTDEAMRSPTYLKRLPLESLVDVEITSVLRRPEPLSLAPSAIDVITGDDIRRAGVTNLPDALRLANGLQVAQISGNSWAISARGFNTSVSNKLHVLMDGRSIYTPLFSGVFWDSQHTFLPDIEQIEVIRGPGASRAAPRKMTVRLPKADFGSMRT